MKVGDFVFSDDYGEGQLVAMNELTGLGNLLQPNGEVYFDIRLRNLSVKKKAIETAVKFLSTFGVENRKEVENFLRYIDEPFKIKYPDPRRKDIADVFVEKTSLAKLMQSWKDMQAAIAKDSVW